LFIVVGVIIHLYLATRPGR